MMWSGVLFCLLFASSAVRALYVTAGSPCYSTCNGANGTWYPDVVCADSDFSSNPKGILLEQCLQCQMHSLYVNGSRSDEYWFLFHMKFLQESCLIDTQNPHTLGAEQCETECNPLRTTLDTLWIHSNPFLPQYDYCTVDANAYPTYGPNCAKCLQGQNDTVIIGNMMETMINACVDQPSAVNGQLVTIPRDLFNTTVISETANNSSITSSTVTATTSATASTTSTPTSVATSAPVSSLQASPNPDSGDHGLSGGAAAGIGIGAAAALIAAAVIVFMLVTRRKKRQQAYGALSTTMPYVGPEDDKKDAQHQRLYREMPENSLSEMDGYEMPQANRRPAEKAAPIAELPGHYQR